MLTRTPMVTSDRSCPLAYLVTATFAGSLIWLWTLLAHVAFR